MEVTGVLVEVAVVVFLWMERDHTVKLERPEKGQNSTENCFNLNSARRDIWMKVYLGMAEELVSRRTDILVLCSSSFQPCLD